MHKDNSTEYPLHILVWNNNYQKLDEYLQNNKDDIESLDPRGRTPLTLAIRLGHIESARVLLRNDADVYAMDSLSWTATHEAICTGDPEMVKLCLAHRDGQRVFRQVKMALSLLDKIVSSPDFYLEMKWEFTSWLPLLAGACPSDVCRVWKKGSNIRVDTTILGMTENNTWLKGRLSYIFKCDAEGLVMNEVNHSQATVYRHNIRASKVDNQFNYLNQSPSDEFVARKLTQPMFVTFLNTGKVEFEKSKSGLFSWLSNRKEEVNNRMCQVYSASNIEIVTLKRTEHLTEEDKKNSDRSNAGGGSGAVISSGIMSSLLSKVGSTEKEELIANDNEVFNPWSISMESYFDKKCDLQGHDIGRPKRMSTHIKRFKARLWMCDEMPLSLQAQILPIIDLMSEYNPHFKKLKDFISLQLPRGYPMKIEIPLYHILTAQITFNNVCGMDNAVDGVTWIAGDLGQGVEKCLIDDKIFQIPMAYHLQEEQTPGRTGGIDEDEQTIQMAMERSLQDYGSPIQNEDQELCLPPKNMTTDAVSYFGEEDIMIQCAIAESLRDDAYLPDSIPALHDQEDPTDSQLKSVLAISKREQEAAQERQQQEDRQLKRILELSMTDK